MRIAVLTFSKEDNNGANLQCYALIQALKSLGHEVEIIDIQLPRVNYGYINRIIHFPQHLQYVRFRRRFMHCFTVPFRRVDDLKTHLSQYDLYIVGSDQVWNLDITKRLDPLVYFFSFLPDSARRMSYAASFGVSEWSWPQWTSEVGRLLSKFETISVREVQGVKICQEVFGVNAQVICDPTLLMPSYDEICEPRIATNPDNELVLFKFKRNTNIEKYLLSQVKAKKLRMVKLGDFHPRRGCVCRPFYSVKTWLNNMRYARFVLTDSFHCMVFCILFNTPFIAMPTSPSRSSRMLSLLRQLNLAERFCWDEKDLLNRFDTIYNTPIDFCEVNRHIEAMRQNGLDFLKSISL